MTRGRRMMTADNAKWAGTALTAPPVTPEEKSDASTTLLSPMKPRPGLRKIHSRTCTSPTRCRCSSWQASVFDARTGKKIRRNFPGLDAAKAWQSDTRVGVRLGTIATGEKTVREAGDALIAGMRAGTVKNRSRRPFKPSVIESYESSLTEHIYAEMGARKLVDVRRKHVQAFADRLEADGKKPSTIRNILMPLRVVFRVAIRNEEVSINPVAAVELPADDGRRDRFATAEETQALIAAVPVRDRAAWALAFYAGLRLGEIRALDWSRVDLEAGEIAVEAAWCNRTKQVTLPKTAAAIRTVPIVGELRRILLAHKLVMGRVGGLVVQRQGGGVESADSLAWRAEKAWKAAKLERITMHSARHTYASLMILARVPITALARFMGHTSITITADRYGHLYPSERKQAVVAFDGLLADGAS